MRSKVLLLSTLLHGAGITCAVVAVHAGSSDLRPTPSLSWSPSRQPPPPPPDPVQVEPFRLEEPVDDAEPADVPLEPFDPSAFTPAPRDVTGPPIRREDPPIPDLRIRPPEPEPEPVTAEPEPSTASESAYVEARVLDSENAPPRYPRRARELGHEGEVHVEVLVGVDGRAEEVRLAKACRHPELNREAVRAVREWRFAPATRGGRPEAAVILVPVEFRLK